MGLILIAIGASTISLIAVNAALGRPILVPSERSKWARAPWVSTPIAERDH